MPKLSIIVPIYNVEKYLHRCLDSILEQTFSDYELILVDDGSPDRCGAICDEYAGKDSRIKVIHKANGGLSSARNAGLDIAEGEYIGFVDSDDYIHPQMYEILLHYAIRDGSDIVCTNLVKEDIRHKHFDTAQTKLYAAKVFKNLRFRPGIIYEDAELMPKLVHAANQVTILTNMPLYCYQINETSITHSDYSAKQFSSVIYTKEHIDFFYHLGLKEQVDAYIFWYMESLIRHNAQVRKKHRELLPQWKPYLAEYKLFRPWLLRNCELSRSMKLLLFLFPAFPAAAEKLLAWLSR